MSIPVPWSISYLCAVAACKNVGKHAFPKDPDRKKRWIIATKIEEYHKHGWRLNTRSSLCSDHFTAADYTGSNKRLKATAVPSIFPWTDESASPRPVNDTSTLDSLKKCYARKDSSKTCKEKTEQFQSTGNHELHEIYSDTVGDEVWPVPDVSGPTIEINYENENHPTPVLRLNDKAAQTDDCYEVPEKCDSAFSVYKYKTDDKAIHFFTGLETYEKLRYVWYTLGDSSNLNYIYGKPPAKLDSFESFFITLMILRRHKLFEEIAMFYMTTIAQVTNIFITWIRFMALQWKNLDLWISRKTINDHMPLDFYDKYPMTRVIIDATECPIKKPGLPSAQQITFSSYKNRNTIKFLIGIAPKGLITYVSPCYGGSATDRQIIERSEILNKFNYNDEIMVDKGLNVQDIFLPYGVKVNIPTFFRKGNQINPETLNKDRKIASKRVHVERVIGMLKTYKILKEPMNKTETLLSSNIVFVCAMLVNFRSNIINKNA